MAIALNDQKTLAGQRIGISSAYAALIYAVIICITPMNVYHLSNLFLNLAGDSWWRHLVYPMSTAITLAEIPLVQAFVTNYRLDSTSFIVKAQGLILALLVSLTVMGGNVSQFISADIKDASIQSHQTTENSYQQKQKVIDGNWRKATRKANRIKDRSKRADAISDANNAYYSASAKLNDGLSKHQVKRPTLGVKNGSFAHLFLVNVVSLALVIVSMSLSGFLAVYYSTLVASPAFSFMSKKAHEWLSNASNFTAANHEISPIDDKQSGMVKVEKTAANNPPALDKTTLGADLDSSTNSSERTLNEASQQGVKVDYSDSHYQAIRAGIVSGDIKPTQRPVMAQLVKLNVRFVDDASRQRKAVQILDNLASEEVLIQNPDYGTSGKVVAKYILNPDAKKGDDAAAIVCMCPECGRVEEVRTTNAAGKVRSVCGAVYIAVDNIVE